MHSAAPLLALISSLCTFVVGHALSFAPAGPPITGFFLYGDQPEAMWVTEFSAFGSGSVFTVPDWQSHAVNNFSSMSFSTVASGFAWPNRVSPVPSNALTGVTDDAILVPDGFLVPFHSNGGIYIVTLSDSKKYKISPDKSGWFYHMAVWLDMNGDGRLDVLTARAHKPLIGSAGGELLWLEQPADPLNGDAWVEHDIVEGPDVLFVITDMDSANSTVSLVSCQFFTELVTMTTVSTKDGSLVSHRIIDQNIGPAYSVEYVDIDGDGHNDLLVTNHMGDGTGGVFKYSGDGFNTKTTLNQGFPVTVKGPGAAAPGFAYALHPAASAGTPSGMATDAVDILVAGDGSGAAYLLTPYSNGTYTRLVVKDVGGTVGSIGLDRTSDKYFFVPFYEKGEIFPFAFL